MIEVGKINEIQSVSVARDKSERNKFDCISEIGGQSISPPHTYSHAHSTPSVLSLPLSLSPHTCTASLARPPSRPHWHTLLLTQSHNEMKLVWPTHGFPSNHPSLPALPTQVYASATNYRNSGGRITKERIRHIPCSGIPRCFEWPLASATEKGSNFNLHRERERRGLAKIE